MGRYPWAEALLFEALHIISFYPTHRHTYRVVILFAMICVASPIYLTPEVTDKIGLVFTVGCSIALYFLFMAYLLFAEGPFPNHWRRVRDEVDVHAKADAGGLDKLPSNFPFAKKLWWMVDIAYSVRMVGWVQEPQGCLPPQPPPSRRTFLWKTLFKLVKNGVIADFTVSVFSRDPAFDSRAHDPTDGPETYLSAVPLLRRVPYILVWGIGAGASISMMHNVMALVCVGLGLSSPTLWPDIWGRWSDAYTVRKLWGQVWHQRLRPPLAGLGRLVANKLLKFPRGTNRSSYTQLYIGFFLSGLIHASGDFLIEKRMVYRSFKFFLLQAVAITFEDFVMYIAKGLIRWWGVEIKVGKADESWPEAVVRVIGYCWVILWFSLALPLWVDELDAAGFGNLDRGPITQFFLDRWKQWA